MLSQLNIAYMAGLIDARGHIEINNRQGWVLPEADKAANQRNTHYMADFSKADLVLARVLHEDDDLMTVELVKNEERELVLDQQDQFYTLLFVRYMEGNSTIWKPWVKNAH